MMRTLLDGAVLGALLLVGVEAAAADADAPSGLCAGTTPTPVEGKPVGWAPYSVRCAGKSECGPTDVVEIKAESAASPALKQAYLELGKTRASISITEGGKPVAAQVLASYPLAPNLAEWVQAPNSEPRRRALLDAPNAKATARVNLVTDGGTYQVPLSLDVTSLWANGVLGLQIDKVSCESPRKFDSTVTLDVPHWPTWAVAAKGSPTKLNLYLDGVKLPEVTATPIAAAVGSPARLAFTLRRLADKPESVSAWSTVMTKALKEQGENAKFSVAVGDERGILATMDKAVEFETRGCWARFWETAGIALILAAVFWFWGRKKKWAWIRDNYAIPEGSLPAGTERSFSLGRIQMLWWTWIIGVSMGCVWLSTGEVWALNETCLILIGISAATAVGAVAVMPDGVAALKTKLDEANMALTGLPAGDSGIPEAQKLVDAAKQRLGDAIKSGGIRQDISSNFGDANAGLHRLQNIAFTLLLGGWFLVMTFLSGAMPSLSTMLLTLMGISGSTYVGFKAAGN
jgi:hypothetical protein